MKQTPLRSYVLLALGYQLAQIMALAQTQTPPRFMAQLGHITAITQIAYSRDGRLVATGGDDQTVRIWEAVTGRELRDLSAQGEVTSIAISSDDQTVVAVTSDTRLAQRNHHLNGWNVVTGRPEDLTAVIVKNLVFAIFSDDNKFLISVEFDGDLIVRFWDQADLRRDRLSSLGSTTRFPKPMIERRYKGLTNMPSAVAFSLDRAFIGAANSHELIVWKTDSEDRSRHYGCGTLELSSFAIASNGGYAAIACGKEIRLTDSGGERILHTLLGHSAPIRSIAFSPEDRVLLSGSDDGTARVWNTDTGKQVGVLRGHVGPVLTVAFSPFGGRALTGGKDKTARVWNLVKQDEVFQLTGSAQRVKSIALSSDNKRLLTADDENITVWDIQTGSVSQQIRQASGIDGQVIFSGDSKRVIARNSTGLITVWDIASGHTISNFGANASVGSIACSPDGRLVITGSVDRTARIWDVNTGRELRRFNHGGSVKTVAFSRRGDWVLTAEGHWMVRLWRTNTGKKISRFDLPNLPEVIPLAGANTAKKPSLFPLARKRSTRQSTDGPLGVFREDSLVLAADDRSILVSESNQFRIFDLGTGRWRFYKQLLPTYSMTFAFSPDGKYVAACHLGGAEIVDITVPASNRNAEDDISLSLDFNKSRSKEAIFPWLEDSPSCAFAPDGPRLLITGSDGPVSIVGNVRWSPVTDRWTGIIEEVGRIMPFSRDSWAVAGANGQFDMSDLGGAVPVHWAVGERSLSSIPMEIFMRDYYEPRLLPRLFAGEKLPTVRSLQLLNRVQPAIKIASTAQGAQADLVDVTVEVAPAEGQFERNGKPVTMHTDVYDLRLFRDGQLVGQEPELSAEAEAKLKNGVVLSAEELKEWKAARQVKPVKDRVKLDPGTGKLQRTFTVRLPHGQAGKEIELTAYAFNEDRVKSETAKARYKVPLDAGPVKRRAYLVAMGVNAYENAGWDLRFAASDARRMQEALANRLDKQQYEVVPVTLISDCKQAGCSKEGNRGIGEDHATKVGLHAVLELLAGHALSEELKKNLPSGAEKIRKAEPDDLVVLSVSSHGYTSKEGMFYVVPSDSGQTDGHGLTEELRKKWISSDELSAWLRDVDAGDLVMIVDTCHSAATVEEPGFKPGPMGSRGLGQLAYDKGMRILAASQADDVALESEKLKQGLLTYALVHDGLESKQAVKAGTKEITLDSWLQYGSERVPTLYQEVLNRKVQTFAEGSKDVRIDEQLSDGTSTLKKPSSFQQPSLFNFQKNKLEDAR